MSSNRKTHRRATTIDEAVRKELCTILAVGAGLADAAEYLRINRRTICNAMRRDAAFRKRVCRARRLGKILLLQKVARAPCWRGAAWMLERKYPGEFSRKSARDRGEVNCQFGQITLEDRGLD